jgi:transposase
MAHIPASDRTQLKMISLEEMVMPDSVARAIDAFVSALPLAELGFDVSTADTGRSPFHPSVFLKLYLYGYMNRIRSSRKLEAECKRNLELMWLLGELTPAFRSIADFRAEHGEQIRNVFKTLVRFSKNNGLIEGSLIAVDGTKVRAQNSKKNNFNQKKIDRHVEYIDNKVNEYMELLQENDRSENDSKGLLSKKEIETAVKKLKDRKEGYKQLSRELIKTGQEQLSTTDPDAKQMIIRGAITEVAYNLQTAVDEKNNLVVHYEASQNNDRNALHRVAYAAKETLNQKKVEVLADKGYHNGGQIDKCTTDGITTYVAPQEHVHNAPVPTADYLIEKFSYNEKRDCYTCPAGQQLTTNGNWYDKSRGKYDYKVKHYKTSTCMECAIMSQCTMNKKGRLIERSQFQKSVDMNNKRVRINMDKYKKRQCINEHVFGIIKRQWGFDHTLMKGLKKVDAETGFIFTAYNFRRIINIIGIEKFIWKIRKGPGFLFFGLIRTLTTALQKLNSLENFHLRIATIAPF